MKQRQEKLVNEYQSSKKEALKKITAEFDAMIANIKSNFIDDVYQEAIKIKRGIKQKQMKESSDFLDKFSQFLDKGNLDAKEINFQIIQGLIEESFAHKQAEQDALQNLTTKYKSALFTYSKIEKTLMI
ncbi:hypothetical protein FGO68_gene16748 [Halteria grandinella]|uniref:Uncharacterized protein n=1 Tax=Halteria grandinella TaxID=5974 RepID=A0A8J8T0K9_HALGN|nr:hypothetical protein FGO68_gene16748 [Halteria grandinella]